MQSIQLFFACILLFFSCQKEANNTDTDQNTLDPAKIYPVIMIHGMLASGDTYANTAMHLLSNGYPENFMYTFDWNSLGGASAQTTGRLQSLVDSVLVITGKQKVILMGHSAGGGVGYSFCNDSIRSKKIHKYIHIASNPQTKPAGPKGEIPTMNIYSKGDKVVAGADIPGAENVVFENLDHYEVATSSLSFEKLFPFITESTTIPKTEIPSLSSPEIRGKVLTLGENSPATKTTVRLYYVDATTGSRKGEAVYTFSPDDKGRYGPLKVDPTAFLEFEISSSEPDFRRVYYYFEPMTHDNPLVYLRVFPPAGSIAGALLSTLPKSDAQSVIAVFSANKAIIHQRDDFSVQGLQLSNATLCSPSNSTIAMFLYDDGNKQSTGNPHVVFSFLPFLKGADLFFQTEQVASTDLLLNGKKLTVRNYKSDSEGVVIAVFR